MHQKWLSAISCVILLTDE
ncbi:OapA N-terminal domain-containing protein [Providencia rettgeri]